MPRSEKIEKKPHSSMVTSNQSIRQINIKPSLITCTQGPLQACLYFFALKFYGYLRSLQPLTSGLRNSARSTLELPVALGIASPGTEPETNPSRESPTFKEKNRENDAETSAEGRFYQEVREAVIPLVDEVLAETQELWTKQ